VLPIARHAAETSTRDAFGQADQRCCIGRTGSAQRLRLVHRRRSDAWRGWFGTSGAVARDGICRYCWRSRWWLAQPARGVATVVFQSIVWQYLSVEDQERVRRTIEEGGSRATSDAPLAWLRFEPSADRMCCEVRLRSWPGRSDDRLLTTAGYHERPVRWLAW